MPNEHFIPRVAILCVISISWQCKKNFKLDIFPQT